jgi:hypothetical protein
MHIEIPRTMLFTNTNFPNHSYSHISKDKVEWFVKALQDSEVDFFRRPPLIEELSNLVKRHYSFVKIEYSKGQFTAEGVPMRGGITNSPLEKAMVIAWTMNCIFWVHGICTPDDLYSLEYFADIRLNYPNLYNLFVEWAWG